MYEEYRKGIPAWIPVTVTWALCLVLSFVLALDFDSPWMWLFMAIHGILFAVYFAILKSSKPHVFKRVWTTDFEKPHVIRGLGGACVLIVLEIVISTLDVYRFCWSSAPLFLSILGVVITWSGYMLALQTLQAQAPHGEDLYGEPHANPDGYGPYASIRHPMVVAVFLIAVSAPLIIGSLFGLIPAALLIPVLVYYTNAEDNWRFANLDWYFDYMKSVAYRVLPMIW